MQNGSQGLNLTVPVLNYNKTATRVHAFVDNASRAQATSKPYNWLVGPFLPGTTHSYFVKAVTADGNFTSAVSQVMIPLPPGEVAPVLTCPSNCSVYRACTCGAANCDDNGTVYIAQATSGALVPKKVHSGQMSVVPLSAGSYTLQAECGSKRSQAVTIGVLETQLRINLTAFSCTLLDKRTCTLTVSSKNMVPVDLFILGMSRTDGFSARSSVKRSTTGWTGPRTITFDDITYDGGKPEDFDLALYIYPKDVYIDLPAAFAYIFPPTIG